VAATKLAVFTCPDDLLVQPFASTTASGRNDIPKVALLTTASYSTCVGTGGPPFTGADTNVDYPLPDIKHLNNGFADYGYPHELRDFVDGTSGTFCVGETTYNNDGSWYGVQIGRCSGFNPSFNVWTMSLRHGSQFRSTRNPLNTLPGVGITAGGFPCGMN